MLPYKGKANATVVVQTQIYCTCKADARTFKNMQHLHILDRRIAIPNIFFGGESNAYEVPFLKPNATTEVFTFTHDATICICIMLLPKVAVCRQESLLS